MAGAGDMRAEMAGRIMGFLVSQAVYVAAKLGIADLVAEGPRPAAALAEAAGADADALYRVLRLLAAHGIFVESEGQAFGNSERSELLREGGGFRDFSLVFGEHFYPAFAEALRLVETGGPVYEAWDEYLAAHPDQSRRFNRFMAGGKSGVAEALAAREWRGDELVVDVGGGNGALLQALISRRPGLRGIVFDLPHVAPEARERLAEAGLADRCDVVAGDYFEGVPDGGDAYVLSHILHGWDDERAAAVLRRVREAIADDGRLLVLDGVVGAPPDPGHMLLDLVMLSVGGRERTEEEWRTLLTAGGFELVSITQEGASVLEAAPI